MKKIKEMNETFVHMDKSGNVDSVLIVTDINDDHGNLLKRFTDGKLCVENKYVYYPSDIIMIKECCEYSFSSGEQLLFVHTEYDEKGHVVLELTPSSTTEYEYDENGNNTAIYVEEYDDNGNIIISNEVHNTYDSNNNLLESVKKFGEEDFLRITNSYDDNNNLLHHTIEDNYNRNDSYSYEYDENGNKVKYTFIESHNKGYSTYEYDEHHRVIRIFDNDDDGSSLRTFEYLCDNGGTIKSVNVKTLSKSDETLDDFDIVESSVIDASRYVVDNDHLIDSTFNLVSVDSMHLRTDKDEYGNITYSLSKNIEIIRSYVYFD